MRVLLLGVQLTSLVNFRGPLIKDLIAAGHEVVAVAPEPVEPWLSQLIAMGARYIEAPLSRTGLNPLKDIGLFVWLWRMFRREHPDILFAFQAKAVIYGSIAARLAGVKRRSAMIEGLGMAFSADKPQNMKRRVISGLLPLLYRISLRCAHLVFFLNPDDVAEFRDRAIVGARQHVVQIPGIGVDLKHFSAQPLPSGALRFLMIARLLVDKGGREYAAAAAIVKARYPDVTFSLLGPYDPSPAGIRPDEVARWQAVTYLGETTDVRPFLASHHALVLPTFYREGMPRSILEAMASGRAIITTDVPGARETVVDQVNGYLVKPRDPEALAEAFIKLIEASPQHITEMGQASRRLAETRYEVGRINQLIIAALSE